MEGVTINNPENMIQIDGKYKELSFLLSENIEYIGYAIMFIFFLLLISKSSYKNRKAKKDLKKMVEKNLHEPLTLHPLINEALCMGCGDCTRVCPEGGTVLQMINHKAVLIKASKCVGHGLCEAVCPVDAIDLVFGTKTRGMDIPRITSDYETNVAGLYISGELGGMGLISNAIKQGQHAAEHALLHLKSSAKTDVDLLIVGGGPAGIAACLAAKKMKKSYICIEQNSIGGAVYNYPRQKIVMVQPIVLPFEGKMKFKKNVVSKEELLNGWKMIIKKYNLNIKEKVSFKGITGNDGQFEVTTNKKSYTAKKVILAMGVGGTPRKLGVANEGMSKVAYRLIDPERYQGKHVAIVGGGNSAVEAAQYLANKKYKNKVTLIVRGDESSGLKRCAEDNRILLLKCVEQGNVQIFYTSSVVAIEKKEILLKIDGSEKKIKNDFIFIFAGAEMPHKFLMSLGIEIEKKFGSKVKAG
jgi:thioredoxin reductase (NADPH)